MSIQIRKMVIPMAAQIDFATLLKKGVWLFVVMVSIIYSVAGSRDELVTSKPGVETWVYVYFNFLSFVLGLVSAAIIFFRRSKSTMAFMTSLMLVTFTSTGSGFGFWYWALTGVPYYIGVENDTVPYAISLFINVLYMGLLTTSLAYVLLAFPEERLVSRSSRWFFGLLVASQVLLTFGIGIICLLDIFAEMGGYLASQVYDFLNYIKAVLLIILAVWPILRLRRITDPVQRQQIKWIGTSLTVMTFFYAAFTFVPYEKDVMEVWCFFFLLVFTYAFIITLLIAMMRYRLWDMNFMINKALVYSSMTAVLGGIGLLGAALSEQFMKSDPSLMTVGILVIVSGVFQPLKERMQAMVDRHFKPEEVDFSSAIVEIAPEAQLMLTSGELLKILVKQSVEQMNLATAAIYLRWADGQLVQSEPAARNPLSAQLKLDDKTLALLEKGSVVVPPEGSPSSLYIPLVLTRASRPDFLGVLVLGPRNSGEGYPTVLLNSLRKLGCDAGKAIYLAQLRERLGQNGMDRRVALEGGLLFRQKPLDA